MVFSTYALNEYMNEKRIEVEVQSSQLQFWLSNCSNGQRCFCLSNFPFFNSSNRNTSFLLRDCLSPPPNGFAGTTNHIVSWGHHPSHETIRVVIWLKKSQSECLFWILCSRLTECLAFPLSFQLKGYNLRDICHIFILFYERAWENEAYIQREAERKKVPPLFCLN